MLVEALLQIQERYGYLPPEELEFLALRARDPVTGSPVPLARIQELTTFFPHFRRSPPPMASVHVCQSMACHLRGAPALLETLRRVAPENRLEVCAVSCLGRCDRAPVAFVSRHGGSSHFHEYLYTQLDGKRDLPAIVRGVLDDQQPPPPDHDHGETPPPWQINVYDPRHGGTPPEPYAAVKRILNDQLTGDEVIKTIEKAGLVGMGGAAARTGNKWREVREKGRERKKAPFVICNADESEPGTFKDRELLLHTPHLILEGMLLAGLSLGAKKGYVYVRHEYHEQIAACRAAIAEARRLVPEALAACDLEVFISPGLYICGEESALIEAIEGKRAQPRNQPPDIRSNGLFDHPTLVNNVETFAWVPSLFLREPADWYAKQPMRFFSISGDVKRPGVHEVPFSCTLGQLIEKVGGMRDGLEFRAVAPSGPSGGFLAPTLDGRKVRGTLERVKDTLGDYDPYKRVAAYYDTLSGDRLSILDLPLNVTLFRALSLSLGAGIVVYGGKPGESVSMLGHAINLLEFFEQGSCGKCVPCRLGCQQLVHFASELHRGTMSLPQVEPTIRALSGVMKVTSICGLGRVASVPFTTWLEAFADEKAVR